MKKITRKFWDIETREILTEDQIRANYEELKAAGETEVENFSQYLENCMTRNNGCLEAHDIIHVVSKEGYYVDSES